MSYEDDKKTIEESLAKIGDLTTSLEEIVKKVDGQEDLTQKWKSEMGDFRKDIKEIKELNDKGGEGSTEKLKELVDKVDEISKTITNSSTTAAQGGADDDKDWDEKKLSKAVKDKADELYKTLDPEQKAYIANNPEKKKEFLKAAQAATSTVPDSLFDEPAGGETTVNEFRKLFVKAGDESNHLSGGGSGGSGGYAGANNQGRNANDPVITKQLPTGTLPRGRKKN